MRNRWIVTLAMIMAAPLLVAQPSTAQSARPGEDTRPAPRWPDGRVNLGPLPGETGVWSGNGGRLVINPNSYEPNASRNAVIHINDAPLQDWTRALVDYRHARVLADEPHTRCKPSPGPRQFITPYGIEIVDMPELQRVIIFDIGGPHSYRIVYMDGRSHPPNVSPSYYGHSIGHWDGDTLVIDTIGVKENTWMNRDGLPHTEQLHLIERVTRVDFNTLHYEVTIDDPGAYTRPWVSSFSLRWTPDTEMWEYICQDNNFAPSLMTGSEGEDYRTSRIVP